MTDERRSQSMWQHAFRSRLRRRFTIMGATLVVLAVVGLLALKALGFLPDGQDHGGSSAGCGLAIKSAQVQETDCQKPN